MSSDILIGIFYAIVGGWVAMLTLASMWDWFRRKRDKADVEETPVGQHARAHCPACFGSVIVALVRSDGEYRLFDETPKKIKPVPEPPEKFEGSGDHIRYKTAVNDVLRRNSRLWIFDPSGTPGMIPWRGQYVEIKRGLTQHYCPLGESVLKAAEHRGDYLPWTY